MRYKRFRKRYKSRVVKMKFQSFVDISTEADKMKIISVNAGGEDVLKRLAPFFGAYKYYKLGGVSIKLIPASTLPVDPTGLSYELGENTVDPRDQLTPGMCRITNGEDILENIHGLNGDAQRELYNNMLLDPRWFKWMLQSGVKRFAKPRYWQIGQLHQDAFPGSIYNRPRLSSSGGIIGTRITEQAYKEGSGMVSKGADGSSHYGIFQTGQRGILGWMPTDGLQSFYDGSIDTVKPHLAAVPEVELFKVLTPPMHKTNYYYRMFITETCYFKDPVVMNINGFRPIDVFKYNYVPGAALPTSYVASSQVDIDQITGGNDGSD